MIKYAKVSHSNASWFSIYFIECINKCMSAGISVPDSHNPPETIPREL